MRPAPGLIVNTREALSRAIATATKGGASKLVRPAHKFQRPINPHQAAHPRSHFSTSAVSAWRNSLETVYSGVFRSVRTAALPRQGPYSAHRLAPRPGTSSSPFPSLARCVHSRPAPRTHFGPTPRPTVPRSTSTLGLSSARNFSSSGFGILDNVVHNAPLALRALAGQAEGFDKRKWKKVGREIRRESTKEVKGKGRVDPHMEMREMKEEFARYFGTSPAAASEKVKEVEPVTLTLLVDPEVDLPVASSSSAPACVDPALERLVTPDLLSSFASITSAYDAHSHRLRSLINRLSHAGLLDPENHGGATSGFAEDEASGRRLWRVTFGDGSITRQRVESVIRGCEAAFEQDRDGEELGWDSKVRRWRDTNEAVPLESVMRGEGHWWWLSGGEDAAASSHSSALLSASPTFPPSLASSVPLSLSVADEDRTSSRFAEDEQIFDVDAAFALAVAETFVLPDPFSSSSSPISPSSPTSLSFAFTPPSGAPQLQSTVSDETTEAWEDFSLASSSNLCDSSIASLSEDPLDAELESAAGIWADGATRDGETWAGSDMEYEMGVRTFLLEVEEERERRRKWGW